jgi:Domain of unknown function (DUF397)
MAIQPGSTTHWTKSTYSANGACLEVKAPCRNAVAVRDSKAPDGPALSFAPSAWSGFVAAVVGDADTRQA